MNKELKQKLMLAGVFIVATIVVIWFMPQASRHKYSYEENRPWSYPLLTAPFDITVYRDSATIKAMTDSIDRSMVPIFRRDPQSEARMLGAVNASSSISAPSRHRLATLVSQLYRRGITDQSAASAIAAGSLKEVKFSENNENISHPTKDFITQREAYSLIDSTFKNSPDRAAIHGLDLAGLLQPNIVEDKTATQLYRESLIQPVIAGIGVIQKGERIIDRGDIVTPQLYQVLQTYEQTLDKQTVNDRSRNLLTALGRLIFVVSIFALVYLYFRYYHKDWLTLKRISAIVLLMTGFFIFAVVLGRTFTAGIYLVPLIIVPTVVLVFFNARTAFWIYTLEVILCAVSANFQFEFIFVELVSGCAVLFSLREISKRSELLISAVVAFVCYTVCYVAVELLSSGTMTSASGRLIGYFAISSVLISFAYIMIFIFEKMFNLVSVMTLVELSDINNPELRTLSTECPGTFQHSMAVSNLASEAAHRIGANVQLVRAGALYHDIGKIDNPAFFTENQHGVNPHDALQPAQSAKIVIGHVTDGLRRAEKAKLPQALRDLIPQHHGRGVTKYFFTMEQRAHPD
ncbi:MAG: HDIG domain-containing protein, partial [Muribaculaceae bacterium]|nr:HDIG domain-containing protein [Muribaculaceae bacterium]